MAAGVTGKVGGRGVTPLNIAERETQTELASFIFWQAPTLLCRFSYLSSNPQVMPEVIPRMGG